jgi:hypothetical protein
MSAPSSIGQAFVQASVQAQESAPKIPTNLTGYQMHKVVNQLRREAGLTSEIPPQMMYNYLGKGYVTAESFPTWVVAYIERAVKRSA